LAYVPEGAGLLYVAASALPYHTSGYTIRTHEIIRALILAGGRVHSLTRSGYPGDRLDRSCDARSNETKVGEVCYLHVAKPANNRPVILYGLQAAPVIAAVAARHRVAVIHAASNHVNALPALLAARQLGIPFQYEMRGLWELTRVSRQPDFDGSQTYKQGLQLENLVARHADRLFVISGQLGRYVAEHWGIPAERIALLPNCVDPDRFAVAAPGEVEACSIGYAGSLIGYEGLDTLIEALARLKESGVAVRVRIVGDGEARSSLESLVRRLEVEDCVQFMGRQTPDVAREVIRRCAVVCLPRKPYEVCRVVPPIKLVEALAMGKSVIVPDLPVFREELGENPAGWFFRAGDSADLAKVLGAALGNLDILRALGARAREYAVSQRCWSKFVGNMLPVVQGGRGSGGTEP
jgi:glycosyltransferase involved in cell wall biosynthesis